jgi:5-methyltetrahydropteroyltriglutamate--homocysteine methyltransferase
MGSRILIHNLGYPRIGAQRQLKKALEKYWAGPSADLTTVAATLRSEHWLEQKNAGVDLVPTNDFSLYDHVLDTIALVGAVPERLGWSGASVDLATYFAMARGQTNEGNQTATAAAGYAMEMTKWFDTNYHYIVPEFWPGQRFSLASQKVVNEFLEARKLGLAAKPVLLGPVTFLKLGKVHQDGFDRYDLLPGLLEVYRELLRSLSEAGAEWVQFDEPAFAGDLTSAERSYLTLVYRELSVSSSQLKLLVATYYNSLGPNLTTFAELPVHGLHLDLTHSGEEIGEFISRLDQAKIVSLGVVDGRNIWRTNYSRAMEKIAPAVATLGEDRIWLAPSCSLMHVPHSLIHESRLDPDLRSWLAFANEKLTELTELRSIVHGDSAPLIVNESVQAARASSERIHSSDVKKRVAEIAQADLQRKSPFEPRARVQRDHLNLPELPTTTIGSFPQTDEVRAARAHFRRGKITNEEYESFLKGETAKVIHWQEKVGLDVLVHGEFERTDMVEYFGEKLRGFAFTENGWVQSYGSRCVKPPILFGDVFRPEPMTVAWATFAQAQTEKPVKGMLTGPITILEWSFVRDDQPRSETARQLALAIRDEVADLEKAGISIIQVDEPALREGLPLREAEWSAYLRWAVDAFRLATADVADRTQIHTHMCYSDFNTILPAIAEMDADVISIESSRSEMELLEGFRDYQYPNEVGPGIWDIHSPRVPSIDEMVGLIRKGLEVLPRSRFWVNPDCGLKTRSWREVEPALENMVAAAKLARAEE